MVCNAIFTVCKTYKAQKQLGRIRKDSPVPSIRFDRASIHFDTRTYTLKGEMLSLWTLEGRIVIPMRVGDHQQRIIASWAPKEAELVRRQNGWFFNLVVESPDEAPLSTGIALGVDVGDNNLAATSTGKLFGGRDLRYRRDCVLALRRRLQSNGSQSAKQRLRQVSGKERRRVTHVNHEVSTAMVAEARQIGADTIVMEDLSHIRDRIKAGKRLRVRLHRWAFRQLQTFVTYKAEAAGLRVLFVEPAYTSQACSMCGMVGRREKHRFFCPHCGLRAHSDLNASRNLARIGASALAPRAAVNQPHVGCVPCHASP